MDATGCALVDAGGWTGVAGATDMTEGAGVTDSTNWTDSVDKLSELPDDD